MSCRVPSPTDRQREARSNGHTQLVEFCHLAYLRALFVLRKWDRLEAAMKECATVFGLPHNPDEVSDVAASGSSNERLWRTIVTIHYLSFRALYEGRSGEDSAAKACIAKLFIVMDMADEKGTLRKLRANGGIVKVSWQVELFS